MKQFLSVIRLYALILLLNLLTAFCSLAQDDALTYFTGEQISGKVLLNWGLKGGFTCNGIGIYRSADSIHYELIGDIQGICGAPDIESSYSFTDTQPRNRQRNFYRLKLGNSQWAGNLGVDVYQLGTEQAYPVPNPATNQVRIHFRNTNTQEASIRVYDQLGHFMIEKQGNEAWFDLDLSRWLPGVYTFFISLTAGTQPITGLLIHAP